MNAGQELRAAQAEMKEHMEKLRGESGSDERKLWDETEIKDRYVLDALQERGLAAAFRARASL